MIDEAHNMYIKYWISLCRDLNIQEVEIQPEIV